MIEGHCGIFFLLVLLTFITVVDVNSCSVPLLFAMPRLNGFNTQQAEKHKS